MARLVARALRLGRSALILGAGCGYQGRYRLSYLAPALMWPEPVILVATESVQQRLLRVEIPHYSSGYKRTSDSDGYAWPNADFQGLLPPP